MGIDLGIKCPAVSYISDGSVKFYGNGRNNKYMRRHYKYLRRKLQKAKHMNTVKRINNKEQRIMKDIDHKLSHSIIETAAAHNVKVIKLERLANIRSTTLCRFFHVEYYSIQNRLFGTIPTQIGRASCRERV